MLFHFKRILMHAADQGGASGGGNANPAPNGSPAPSSAQPPAQPQAQGAGVTREELSQLLKDHQDATFAALRKAGVFGTAKTSKDTKPADPPPDPNSPPSSRPAGPDPRKMRSLDRVLTRTGLGTKLSERQYQRLEDSFAAEDPDDVDGWVKDYFEGFAPSQPAGAPPAAQQPLSPPQPGNARPVTDAGAPPAAKTPLEEQDLLTMSESDRRHLLQTKGAKWFTDTLERQVRDKKFKLVK